VQCRACSHFCLIESTKRGKPRAKAVRGRCGVRENRGGKLYSLVYGKPCAIAIDPIEKKPLYHFLPKTKTLSIATVGCNFACHSCQNWQISQGPKLDPAILPPLPAGAQGAEAKAHELSLQEKEVSPQKVVDLALRYKTPSISYTYTEPTIFLDYAFDTMKIAKSKGLKNIWVSNGFFSEQALDLILPFLNAINVDLKGFSEEFYQKYCAARLEPVLDSLKALFKDKVHLEITTLVIPALNDKEDVFQGIANFIKTELSAEVPWHISAFSPGISWKLKALSATPFKTLEKAWDIGQKVGLKHVHLGNI